MRNNQSGTQMCGLSLTVLVFGAALYPGTLARILVAIGLVGLLAFRGDRDFSINNFRVPLLLALLMAYLMISSLWSGDFRPALLNSVSYVALTCGAILAALKLDWRNLLGGVALSLRIILFVSWTLSFSAGFRVSATPGSAGRDVSGLFFHENMFATVCVIAVLTFLAELFSRERRFWPGIWLIIALWSLWVSDSRTGQIVLVVVVLSTIFVKWARRDKSMTVATIGIFGILTAGLAAALVGLNTSTISLALGRGQNFTGRTEIWSATLKEIANSPWIGTGFLTAWRDDNASAIRIRGALGFRAAHAHNGYLDVWLQLGVIGLLLILGLVLVAGSRALRLYWSGQSSYYLWALAICVANVSYNLTETRFTLAIAWVLSVAVYAKLSDDVRSLTHHKKVAEQGKVGSSASRTKEGHAEAVLPARPRRGFAGQR